MQDPNRDIKEYILNIKSRLNAKVRNKKEGKPSFRHLSAFVYCKEMTNI